MEILDVGCSSSRTNAGRSRGRSIVNSISHSSRRVMSWMGLSFLRGMCLRTLKIKPSVLSATRKCRFRCPRLGKLMIGICRLISAMDGNLPNKPCQTCKNSFHASCLYEVRVFFARPITSYGSQLMVILSGPVVQEQSLVELPPVPFQHY